MSTPQLEVEVVYARGVFNEAFESSTPDLREAAESYRTLLNEYLEKLDQSSPGTSATEQTHGRPLSLGAAAKPALDDSIEWVRAELGRVSLALDERRPEVSEFQDKELTCENCRQEFTWDAGEQEFFREKGLTSELKRCQECRQANKQRRTDRDARKGDGT